MNSSETLQLQCTEEMLQCTEETPDQLRVELSMEFIRINPRLVFTNPDVFFGRDMYHDLLMEQQEQM